MKAYYNKSVIIKYRLGQIAWALSKNVLYNNVYSFVIDVWIDFIVSKTLWRGKHSADIIHPSLDPMQSGPGYSTIFVRLINSLH